MLGLSPSLKPRWIAGFTATTALGAAMHWRSSKSDAFLDFRNIGNRTISVNAVKGAPVSMISTAISFFSDLEIAFRGSSGEIIFYHAGAIHPPPPDVYHQPIALKNVVFWDVENG